MIIVVAIMVLLPVGFVVFLVVANEIGESESVVRGDKIDAGVRPFAIVLIKIGAARQPIRHFADLPLVPLPTTANGVPILPDLFPPPNRNIPDMRPAVAHV